MKYTFGHLCFLVSDMERSVAFYCEKLGFQKMFEQRFEVYDMHCVYLRIAQGQFIELFNAKKPLDNTNASFQHLCLHVDDAAAAHEELASRGVDVTPVEFGMSKIYKFYFKDPDGHSIEVMQLTDESLQTIHDHD